MATRQEIEQALVAARQRYEAAETQEEKDLIRQKAQVLVKSLESQQTTADVPQLDVEALQQKGKTDPQGVAMSIIAGLNRGAVAMADLPSDLVNLAVGTVLNPAPEVKRLMESVPFFVVPNAILDLVNKIPQDVKDNYLKVARPSEVVGRNVERVTGFDPIQAATTPMEYAQDTGVERMLGTVGEYAGGGLAVGTAAPRIAQSLLKTPTGAPTPTPRIGEQIAARPNQFLAQEAGYSAAAGVGGGVAREQFPESPMAELVGSLLTGVGIPMAAGAAGSIKIPFKESLSKQAVERRVGTALIDSTADVDTAIANLTTNRKVMERVVGEGTEVNAVQLTQDPTLIAAVDQVARTDNSLLSILGRIKDNTEKRLISIFQDIRPMPKTEAGKAVVGAAETVEARRVAAGNELLLRLQDEIDLAKNTIDQLEAKFGGADDPTISVEFVDALKTSYNRAKQVERDLWASVDKTVKLEPKALITSLKQLRKVERDKPYAAGTIPEDLFNTAKKLIKKPTFENLTVYRTALTDARRNTTNTQTQAILDKMVKEVDGFLEDFDFSEVYMVARNYTRSLHEEYDQGKLGKYLSPTRQGNLSTDPQVALSRIVRAGDNVGDVERAIIAEQGGTLPPAEGLTPKIMEYLRSKFSQQSIVQGRGRDAFFKKYAAVLKRFPELARDLGSINAELKALSQSIAQKEGRAATVLDENRTAVSALLGAEPDNLLPTLSQLGRDDLKLVATVMDQEGVLSGLQSVYIDEFIKRLTRVDQRGNVVFKDNNVQNIIRESVALQRGWDEVLSPKQKIAIRRIEKARSLYAKSQQSGSADEILSTLQADALTLIVSRSLGIRAAAEAVPSGAASLQAAAAFSNFTKNIINRLTRDQSIAVLRKAITDPDYLEKLLIASKAAEVSGDVQTVNAYLFAAGIQNVEGQNRENR
jgi:hypothetical protein